MSHTLSQAISCSTELKSEIFQPRIASGTFTKLEDQRCIKSGLCIGMGEVAWVADTRIMVDY